MARDVLVRHAEVDKGVLKGRIETMLQQSDRQQPQLTSMVSELSANYQASADAKNTLLDCGLSQSVVGHDFRATRPAASLCAPTGSSSGVTPLPPVVTTIRKPLATRVACGRDPQVPGPPSSSSWESD